MSETVTHEELVEREEIKDSPFVIITIGDEAFGTMGKYRITEVMKNAEEVRAELTPITWNRLIQVISIINEHEKNLEKMANE